MKRVGLILLMLAVCTLPAEAQFSGSGGGLPSVGGEGDCLLTSSGVWAPGACPGAGTGAPTTAGYWTKTADATLSNEFAMGGLTTGLVVNTITTGVPTIYAGSSCTNQTITALNASGAATCSTITSAFVNNTVWTGTAASGILKASSQGVLTTATAGTDYTSPISTESFTNKTLDCNATGNICSNIDLTADVINILPAANGGTGNAFTSITGPASSTKTFTFPNASATMLTTNSLVTLAQGGTNQNSWTAARCVRVNAGGTALESAGADCGAGGGGGAPTDAQYLVGASDATLSAEIVVTPTDDNVMVGNGTTWEIKSIPDCDNATTSKLLYDQGTNAFSCGTDQSSGGGTTFDQIGTGSNTTATHTVGSGGSLVPSGTGVVASTAARPNVTTVNAGNSPYTALTTDFILLCDTTAAGRTITLPAATNKLLLRVKNLGANSCTINRAGSDTIDGATSAVLTTQYEAIDVVADASASWSVF